ncbi:MAG TPA: hypothetical protein EYO76_01005, partial [Flavobacteriaceae bacterium]|nr:hypothetical protein [Flavobacteriaceae bacterium]
MINNYNREWMEAWDGNMDLQVCLDFYSVMTYTTDYFTKSEPATINTLREVAKEKKNSPAREKMFALAQAYLKSREMGECEVEYRILPSLNLVHSNIKTIFVGTGFPENRSKFLYKLDDNNVTNGSLEIDGRTGRYIKRESIDEKYSRRCSDKKKAVEKLCLAQFATIYDVSKKSNKDNNKDDKDEIEEEDSNSENEKEDTDEEEIFQKSSDTLEQKLINTQNEPNKYIILCDDDLWTFNDGETVDKNNSKAVNNRIKEIELPDFIELEGSNTHRMKKRKYRSVMRFHKCKKDKVPHEYCYSELFLFKFWKTEDELFAENIDDCIDLYEKLDNKSKITKVVSVKDRLYPFLKSVEEGREMVQQYEMEKELRIGEELDAAVEQQNDDDREIGCTDAEEFGGLQPHGLEEEKSKKDMSRERIFKVPDTRNVDKMLESVRKLVPEQRVAFDLVINFCKKLKKYAASNLSMPQAPLLVIHGSAGSGKSQLIHDISNWVEKILRKPEDNVDHPYVVRVAFTGVAAANIDGATIHSAFHFKFGKEYRQLTPESDAKLKEMTENLKVLICDEFSMLDVDYLYMIHERLCDLKQEGYRKQFGNIAIILVGDLMQLKPVKGTYIFEDPKNPNSKNMQCIWDLWKQFECVELRENHRQGEDKQYANLLNRLRLKPMCDKKGECKEKCAHLLPEDFEALKSRLVRKRDIPEDALEIYATNVMANESNTTKLTKQDGDEEKFKAKYFPENIKARVNPDGSVA